VLYLTNVMANYGLGSWMPSVIEDSNPALKASDPDAASQRAALLTAIPWVVTLIAMITNGWHSDKNNERKWHFAIPHVVGAAGLIGSLFFFDNTVMLIICLCFAAAGINCVLGVFWALPAAFLTGAAAAGGIAMINSLGNLGGFIGPYTLGALKKTYGYDGGFIAMACSLILGAILVLMFNPKKNVK